MCIFKKRGQAWSIEYYILWLFIFPLTRSTVVTRKRETKLRFLQWRFSKARIGHLSHTYFFHKKEYFYKKTQNISWKFCLSFFFFTGQCPELRALNRPFLSSKTKSLPIYRTVLYIIFKCVKKIQKSWKNLCIQIKFMHNSRHGMMRRQRV